MGRRAIKILKNLVFPLISLAALLLFWFFLALAVGKDLIIPSPGATFSALFEKLSNVEFYNSVFSTLLRSMESYALSAVVGFLMALLAAISVPMRKLFAPFVGVMRAVPTMSVILLSVIWLKPKYSPILVAFLIAFPVLYSGFLSAFLAVDKKLIMMSKSYRVSLGTQIKDLYVPSILPSALDTLGSTASLNVKIVISAEVLAVTANSVGQAMQLDKIYLETASLLAWTIVAILMSYLFEVIFFAIKKCLVRWER